MANDDTGQGRRLLIKAASAGLLMNAIGATSAVSAGGAETAKPGTGKPGDFAFLHGEWTIANRQRKKDGTWDEFPGEATCWTILEGVGSVEELRIPERKFSGMGLRLLDVEKKIWSDFWVNSKSGVLAGSGTPGVFVNGVGSFEIDDADESGKPIRIHGVWDEITKNSCRWRQGMSRDGGKTWVDDWIMNWTRVTRDTPASPRKPGERYF